MAARYRADDEERLRNAVAWAIANNLDGSRPDWAVTMARRAIRAYHREATRIGRQTATART